MRAKQSIAPNRRNRVGRGVRLPPADSPSRLPEPKNAPGLVFVGRFGAPQGVKGEVRVQSFTADPLAIGAYGPLCDAGGMRAFALSDLRPLRDNMLVASVAGVDDRDAAAALTGMDLFARRENLPPPDEDEVYVADLIGLSVEDANGLIGTVADVKNFGAGDILEITPAEGGETLLVPFTKAFVPTIDLPSKRIIVILPPETE